MSPCEMSNLILLGLLNIVCALWSTGSEQTRSSHRSWAVRNRDGQRVTGRRPRADLLRKSRRLGRGLPVRRSDGVVWESCRLTSSGPLTAFSDFPVSSNRAGHMAVGEYVDYLAQYCAAFDVTRHIRFGTRVESVVQNPSGSAPARFQVRALRVFYIGCVAKKCCCKPGFVRW
jgi:hypothetical protein